MGTIDVILLEVNGYVTQQKFSTFFLLPITFFMCHSYKNGTLKNAKRQPNEPFDCNHD